MNYDAVSSVLTSSVFTSAVTGFFFANLRLNFSTRPALSTSFCLPVKNGWHIEQISTFICGTVERVVNKTPRFSPQLHITSHFIYFGCVPFFMVRLVLFLYIMILKTTNIQISLKFCNYLIDC